MMSSEAKDEKSNLIAANECCGCLMTVTADFKVVNPGRAPNAAKGEDYPTYCIDGKSLNLVCRIIVYEFIISCFGHGFCFAYF